MAAVGTGTSEFLAGLETRSRVAAVDVVTAARAAGASVWQIVDDVIRPALVEVGFRWERDEWSVAHEHAATVVADFALSSIAVEPPRIDSGEAGRRLVVACPAGEWHALAPRAVGEALRERGWDVTFLGAAVPAHQLDRFLGEHRPAALLLGVTMAGHVPAALECVSAARAAGVPTVLGGAAVTAYPGTAAAIGAYGAHHAGIGAGIDAVDAALRHAIAAGPAVARSRTAAREHCAELRRSRLRVADAVGDVDGSGAGALGPAWAAQQEFVRGAALPLVDALAASVLVDDDRPFADLVTWFRAAGARRGLDPERVDGVLDAIEDAVGAAAPAALTAFASATARRERLSRGARR